jgi:hypothetical protein
MTKKIRIMAMGHSRIGRVNRRSLPSLRKTVFLESNRTGSGRLENLVKRGKSARAENPARSVMPTNRANPDNFSVRVNLSKSVILEDLANLGNLVSLIKTVILGSPVNLIKLTVQSNLGSPVNLIKLAIRSNLGNLVIQSNPVKLDNPINPANPVVQQGEGNGATVAKGFRVPMTTTVQRRPPRSKPNSIPALSRWNSPNTAIPTAHPLSPPADNRQEIVRLNHKPSLTRLNQKSVLTRHNQKSVLTSPTMRIPRLPRKTANTKGNAACAENSRTRRPLRLPLAGGGAESPTVKTGNPNSSQGTSAGHFQLVVVQVA